jgi:hypothetical protein
MEENRKLRAPKLKSKPIIVDEVRIGGEDATKGDEKKDEVKEKKESPKPTIYLKSILATEILGENSPPLSPNRVQNGILSIYDKQLIVQSALSYDYTNPSFVRLHALVMMKKPLDLNREARFYVTMPEGWKLNDNDEAFLFLKVGTLIESINLICASTGYDIETEKLYLAPKRIVHSGIIRTMTFDDLNKIVGPVVADTWHLQFSGHIRTK